MLTKKELFIHAISSGIYIERREHVIETDTPHENINKYDDENFDKFWAKAWAIEDVSPIINPVYYNIKIDPYLLHDDKHLTQSMKLYPHKTQTNNDEVDFEELTENEFWRVLEMLFDN